MKINWNYIGICFVILLIGGIIQYNFSYFVTVLTIFGILNVAGSFWYEKTPNTLWHVFVTFRGLVGVLLFIPIVADFLPSLGYPSWITVILSYLVVMIVSLLAGYYLRGLFAPTTSIGD